MTLGRIPPNTTAAGHEGGWHQGEYLPTQLQQAMRVDDIRENTSQHNCSRPWGWMTSGRIPPNTTAAGHEGGWHQGEYLPTQLQQAVRVDDTKENTSQHNCSRLWGWKTSGRIPPNTTAAGHEGGCYLVSWDLPSNQIDTRWHTELLSRTVPPHTSGLWCYGSCLTWLTMSKKGKPRSKHAQRQKLNNPELWVAFDSGRNFRYNDCPWDISGSWPWMIPWGTFQPFTGCSTMCSSCSRQGHVNRPSGRKLMKPC